MPDDVDTIRACKAGAARSTVQAGDVRGGVALALRSGSKAVMRDCAALLCDGRGAGTVMEAAELYEAAGDAEQAVAVYLDAKALARAEPLMKCVSTPKLILAVRVYPSSGAHHIGLHSSVQGRLGCGRMLEVFHSLLRVGTML